MVQRFPEKSENPTCPQTKPEPEPVEVCVAPAEAVSAGVTDRPFQHLSLEAGGDAMAGSQLDAAPRPPAAWENAGETTEWQSLPQQPDPEARLRGRADGGRKPRRAWLY